MSPQAIDIRVVTARKIKNSFLELGTWGELTQHPWASSPELWACPETQKKLRIWLGSRSLIWTLCKMGSEIPDWVDWMRLANQEAPIPVCPKSKLDSKFPMRLLGFLSSGRSQNSSGLAQGWWLLGCACPKFRVPEMRFLRLLVTAIIGRRHAG